MRVECPCCGPRDHGEFSYLGDAAPTRPEGLGAEPDAMVEYVYIRDNPAGPHRELWYHAAGCRSWLVVTRDTRTHAISDVVFARDVGRASFSRSAGEGVTRSVTDEGGATASISSGSRL